MCGIVGAVATQNVVPILIDGLKRLEYRGYDSAGIAVLKENQSIQRMRVEGKVARLNELLEKSPLEGNIGIAHTRWATHGKPSERNAHPHIAKDRVVLVHNGIIENYESLKLHLSDQGKSLLSETDSEIVAYHIYEKLLKQKDVLQAVQETVQDLEGAYALCVMDTKDPDRVIGVRCGPPLVIGLGESGHFLASDVLALQRVCDRFIYLEEGDIAEISRKGVNIFDKAGKRVERKIYPRVFYQDASDKGGYRHFMLKEIFEQPSAVQNTLEGRIHKNHVLEQAFGVEAAAVFDKTKRVQIIACGTSYHAGLLGRLWLEGIANIPCEVEIASEFRYRKHASKRDTLLVCISQSGETADTLAALRGIKKEEYSGTLSICNVPDSSLVRESELCFMTQAGPEIGVCSTKAFTTQLIALFLLTLVLGRRFGLDKNKEADYLKQITELPNLIDSALDNNTVIEKMAEAFLHKSHTLYLGRGLQFPIALEGALKLKEISYIHAEAYPAGELKHGPLALVDKDMPVIVVAAKDALLDKVKSNIQEVRARGGELFVFTPPSSGIKPEPGLHVITIPEIGEMLSPILYTVPLQLLAYYVAVLKGTDVDQPRNLAKSVTVE